MCVRSYVYVCLLLSSLCVCGGGGGGKIGRASLKCIQVLEKVYLAGFSFCFIFVLVLGCWSSCVKIERLKRNVWMYN